MRYLRKFGENIFLSLVGQPYFKRRARSPEVFVISYRKSGRTWLRMMIAKAIAIYFNCQKKYIFCPEDIIRRGYINAPLVDFTHADELLEIDDLAISRYINKKNLVLVRDPRDVLVSYYFHLTKRDKLKISHGEIITHTEFGLERIINFMNKIYELRNISSEFSMVRYEDLKKDTFNELKRIILCIGLKDITERTINEAINYASIENMRRLSLSELKNERRLAPADPDDPDSFKVRKGSVGGYRDFFSSKEIEYINEIIKSQLNPAYGYKTV